MVDVYLSHTGQKMSRASPPTQYVTLHWKAWMRFNTQNPVYPLEECSGTLKTCTRFQSPGGAIEQSNKHSQILFIDCALFLLG